MSDSSATQPPLLEVTDLRTSFNTQRGVVRAVDGVSLRLERGETIGIVGESGSGKSVLSRSVMGLLPPTNVSRSGSVRFRGAEIGGLSRDDSRAYWGTRIAMIFQDPMTSLNPTMRIGAQITEGLRQRIGMSKQNATATAIELLRSVRIPEPERRMGEYPHRLSGGMRQRVVIAIALACGPELLIADEPTTALDVTVQEEILDLLEAQQRERHMGIILVTHDLGVVATRADTIAVMYAGQIVEIAPTATLFERTRTPYAEALMRSIPKLSDPTQLMLPTIAGRPPDLVRPTTGCRFAPRCAYAQQRCFAEAPPLRPADTADHLYRCWYPVGEPTVASTVAEQER